jgi:hypothetical protein
MKNTVWGVTSALVLLTSLGQAQAQSIVKNVPAYSSSTYNNDYTNWGPQKANDGPVTSKWTSVNGTGHYIYFDMGYSRPVGQVTVRHASEGGEPTYFNLKSYDVKYWNGSSWTYAASVSNWGQAPRTHSYVNFSSRYVGIWVTNSGIDGYARIPEIRVFGPCNPTPPSVGWPFPGGADAPGNFYSSRSSDLHLNDDQYAQDWFDGASNLCGANVYAPISGTVLYAGKSTYAPGYGTQVVIRSSVNPAYAVRIAHLQDGSTGSLGYGSYVSVGSTIGTLGMSGSDVCHAHVVAYNNIDAQSPYADNTGVEKLKLGAPPSGSIYYGSSPFQTAFDLNSPSCYH